MSENVAGLPNRGKTFYGPTATIPTTYGADSLAIEGSVHVFEDVTIPTSPGARVKRSNYRQKCVLVRNTGASSLVAGAVQKWETGYRGRRTDGNSSAANGEIAGVVDPFLGAAVVRAGDLYWLVIKGRVTAAKATGTAHTEGDLLACDTGGKLTAIGTPGTDTAAMEYADTAAGRAYADAGSSDTTVDAYINVSKWID